MLGVVSRVPTEHRLQRVVAAVVRENGNVFICQRPFQKQYGGKWEFPGGKVEHGESAFQTVSRELLEELGVEVTGCSEILFTHHDELSNTDVEFRSVSIRGIPQSLEHLQIAWVPERQLPDFDLLPGDSEFVRSVLGLQRK